MSNKLITCLNVYICYIHFVIYIFCQTYNYGKYIQFFVKFSNQSFGQQVWPYLLLHVISTIKGGKVFIDYLLTYSITNM